jgi:cyclopropane-fatty-acyl-phospholipid synthase
MKTDRFKKITEEISSFTGINVNGNEPWDIKVHNEQFHKRCVMQGSLGLGESYMDGWWDCERLDEFIFRLLNKEIDEKININWKITLEILLARIINLQSKLKAFHVGEKHYDLGNDLFVNMLDKRMVYSCAYWKDAKILDEAQEAKLDLVCRKLGLQPGMKLLDIGCGWGSLLKYAAEKYKVKAVGITVSKEQARLGRELCIGLPIEIRLQDYRDLDEKFDCIASLGMAEHVGYKNYRSFMKTAHRCLSNDGSFLLHTIGANKSTFSFEPWINKYIFPGAMIPSVKQIGKAVEGLFVMEDWHSFGTDYDKTLMAWHKNFNDNWDKIKHNYSKKFYRMWRYYLLLSAGSFRARRHQLWQIVLSKKGVPGGYKSIR